MLSTDFDVASFVKSNFFGINWLDFDNWSTCCFEALQSCWGCLFQTMSAKTSDCFLENLTAF